MYTHLYICMCKYLCVCVKCEFMFFSTLIHYHMDHSSLPLLVCNLALQQQETLPHLPTISLTVHFRYTFIMVSELLTRTPVRNNFVRQTAVLRPVTLPLVLQVPLISLLPKSAPFLSSPISEVVSYVCNAIDYFFTFCIPSWDPSAS